MTHLESSLMMFRASLFMSVCSWAAMTRALGGQLRGSWDAWAAKNPTQASELVASILRTLFQS